MKKVSELIGAELDYYTARAEGIPAEHLAIVLHLDDTETCIRHLPLDPIIGPGDFVRHSPSTNWHLAGALIEKHPLTITTAEGGYVAHLRGGLGALGATPQVAICRAVVRAAFGDDVGEVAVCE